MGVAREGGMVGIDRRKERNVKEKKKIEGGRVFLSVLLPDRVSFFRGGVPLLFFSYLFLICAVRQGLEFYVQN